MKNSFGKSGLDARSDSFAPVPVGHTEVIHALAHLVQAMIPLANSLQSDEFSVEERKQFRTFAGDNVFELSTSLNRLCSETARKVYSSKK